MAAAVTSTASGFLRAVSSALIGGSWKRLRKEAQPLEPGSLRESEAVGMAPGAVAFQFLGEVQVSEDTERQSGPVDSARMSWSLPLEARVGIAQSGEPAEVVCDVIETAMRLLFAAPDVRRAGQRLSLSSGAVSIHSTEDWVHARVSMTLSVSITHDLRPGRTPDRLTP